MTPSPQDRPSGRARILVTGARGFVGRPLVDLLLRAGYSVRGTGRGDMPSGQFPANFEWCRVSELSADMDWTRGLEGVDLVVHLAARVHRMHGDRDAAAYLRTNVEGTMALAEQAARAGIKRFVFMSSVKVSGERTAARADGTFERYTEDSVLMPEDAYARSKLEAEQRLKAIADRGGFALTILRPPLVYGPGVGANFLRLMAAVRAGRVLPVAAIRNRRSLVYVENLADAVLTCIESEVAANKTYFVRDADVSTPELVESLARAMGGPARMSRVPRWLLRVAGRLIGRGNSVSRLTDSLLVDDSRIRSELHWTPPFTFEQGIARTVDWYLHRDAAVADLRTPASAG